MTRLIGTMPAISALTPTHNGRRHDNETRQPNITLETGQVLFQTLNKTKTRNVGFSWLVSISVAKLCQNFEGIIYNVSRLLIYFY